MQGRTPDVGPNSRLRTPAKLREAEARGAGSPLRGTESGLGAFRLCRDMVIARCAYLVGGCPGPPRTHQDLRSSRRCSAREFADRQHLRWLGQHCNSAVVTRPAWTWIFVAGAWRPGPRTRTW
jgi:hypothetical protein